MIDQEKKSERAFSQKRAFSPTISPSLKRAAAEVSLREACQVLEKESLSKAEYEHFAHSHPHAPSLEEVLEEFGQSWVGACHTAGVGCTLVVDFSHLHYHSDYASWQKEGENFKERAV